MFNKETVGDFQSAGCRLDFLVRKLPSDQIGKNHGRRVGGIILDHFEPETLRQLLARERFNRLGRILQQLFAKRLLFVSVIYFFSPVLVCSLIDTAQDGVC